MLCMVADGKPAKHHVAEEIASQLPCRGHHPTHTESGTELLSLTCCSRPSADDLLEGDNIRLSLLDNLGNPDWVCTPVQTTASVDVIGDDS